MADSLYDLLVGMARGDRGAEEGLRLRVASENHGAVGGGSQSLMDGLPDPFPGSGAVPAIRPSYEPFEHSRPCTGLLSIHQAEWYAWWRARGDHAEPLPNGYGYRLLLAGESVRHGCVAGSIDCLDALDKLAVGAENKDVRNHIITWSGDLAWLLGEDDRALWSYERVRSGVLPSIRLAMGLPTEYGPRRLSELVRGVEYLNAPSPYSVARRKELLPFFRWFITEGDKWCREHAGCWLADLLGRPTGMPHAPFRGVPGVTTAMIRGRRLVEHDLKASAMPGFPHLLRCLENLHRKAAGTPSKLKEGDLPPLVRDMVDACAPHSPHLNGLMANRTPRVSGHRGVRLRRTLVSRLARESARLHTLTAEWLEAADGGLFAGDECCAVACSDDAGSVRCLPDPVSLPDVAGTAAFEADSLLSLFEGGPRIETARAREWASTRGLRLVLVLDGLNNSAIDLCDAPVITEEGSWLILDFDVLAVMGQ